MEQQQLVLTDHAIAERATPVEIERQVKTIANLELMQHLLEAVPDLVVILNETRQAVYANQIMLAMIAPEITGTVIGLRPGEILSCVNAYSTPGGCGTTRFCRTCGAVNAVLTALMGNQDVQECRINREVDGQLESVDLRIWATPLVIRHERYTIFAALDISNEKRRQALEQIFFHDVLNTAGTLRGALELIKLVDGNDEKELEEMVDHLSNRLIDEIQAQRDLVMAESGEIIINSTPADSLTFLTEMQRQYQTHPVAENKQLVIASSAGSFGFSSDMVLLGRIIGNMVKNALEASESGETVTMGCNDQGNQIQFWVHNQTIIPHQIQHQLFQRSFSTKGAGRGLGTYSMRLLGERYLQGTISFRSNEREGTLFVGTFPRHFDLERGTV